MNPADQARPAGGLTVLEHRDAARLGALKEEWRALFDAAQAPSPFLSWEWLHTFHRCFAARRPIWILEARDPAARLAGLLVLSGRHGLLGERRWSLLGNGLTGADGLDVLARPDLAAAARSAVARALAAGVTRWDVLDLEDLPCGSPTLSALREAMAPTGVRTQVERGFVCPGFVVRGTFEEHLARIRRRETYGRRVRWLERQPGFRVEVTTSQEEAAAAMDDFLRLHRLRWQVEGGSSGIPPGPVEDFHRELAPLLAERGWLRLYRLFVGRDAIAAVYGLEVGRRFFYYQSGYDPAWSARSPGVVLVGRTVEDAYARGLTDYDFLRGTEAYKMDWAWDRRETCSARLQAPSVRAGTAVAAQDAFRAARGFARSVAPELVWGALRRARRSLEASGLAGARGG
ncbi:GNAT family N-acetyltransferase [Anaeromyxobacter sp. Fw109-5]|uniref:GNAT family N-acetyltransferase n=1 Tax=Anaeromyxobacter sp. (strain Fw109-5) TaxID=404589 RepID=UPI0000ED7549|nr:GNAT family N-acetyltransferase [Anaeromyxobacter sp. Fw109-5]ABS26811.1 cellulose biosynthesis (CelD)-like protein [Anaeromyxobacter sp. Fw109-5]